VYFVEYLTQPILSYNFLAQGSSASSTRVSHLQRAGNASMQAMKEVHVASDRNHAPQKAAKLFADAWESVEGSTAPR